MTVPTCPRDHELGDPVLRPLYGHPPGQPEEALFERELTADQIQPPHPGLLLADQRDGLGVAGLERRTRLRATLAAHDTGTGVYFDSRAWIITALRLPVARTAVAQALNRPWPRGSAGKTTIVPPLGGVASG
ncbi:hypothetical protein ABT061_29820 [Streptosporangium sp. NPDC002544]|uniref:hypothetical protein n=1 Tax=Streptosporangium sp. NPDC002544 TaxID=3154538 RepID=UPI0033175455